MSLPGNIPELSTLNQEAADGAEVSRCLEDAAKLVHDFAHEGAPGTLDALLIAAEDGPGASAKRALELAKTVTERTGTLHAEVERFLSSAKPA